MMVKPMKTLELHYPMIQFLIKEFIPLKNKIEAGADLVITITSLRESDFSLAIPQPRTNYYKRNLSYSSAVLCCGIAYP